VRGGKTWGKSSSESRRLSRWQESTIDRLQLWLDGGELGQRLLYFWWKEEKQTGHFAAGSKAFYRQRHEGEAVWGHARPTGWLAAPGWRGRLLHPGCQHLSRGARSGSLPSGAAVGIAAKWSPLFRWASPAPCFQIGLSIIQNESVL
jgi:hypothetical protein